MRQWLQKILLVLAGIIFALVLCEAGLRLLGIGYPQFYDFDPQVGAKLRPGMTGYWSDEGGGYVSINSAGLRDREHAIKKPPKTLRIAVLGDSYTEALQVNRKEAFCAVLEKQLQGCANLRGRKIEVINFGQAGIGTTQELLALRDRVWKYSPDIILLAFCTGNDISDNSPALNNREAIPFYVLKDGKLVLDDSRVKSYGERYASIKKKFGWRYDFYRWRQDTFRVVQLGQHVQKIVEDWWSAGEPGKQTGSVKPGSVEPGMFMGVYREPSDEVWKEAWQVTEAVLLQMRDEVARKGARLYVVALSNDIQVHPDESVRNKFARCPGIADVFYPDKRLEKFCQSHGIPVLLLAPSFQKYAARHHIFLHGFHTLFRNTLGSGHWNQNGHRLAGETIAEWLCPQIN